ncbi:glutathione synthetase [Neisseria gonorrhoeae]|uniref:Glutathione synthetase n=1 Tax=Neisseria gonorrhoeae TaxID=485 RepID=A0A378VX22_NEIGO|nr:glutathione synthetase [Neisseria gonorrhoeae]
MRTDPPFDMQYLYSTQLLTLAEQQGAKVFNSGRAMRDFNEKLAILNFSRFTAPTLVTTRSADVRAFLKEHGDIIVKPLDGMGGMGIFRLTEKDPNIGSILETLMRFDSRTIMAQRYIPEIVHGDKRILIIGGEVVPMLWRVSRKTAKHAAIWRQAGAVWRRNWTDATGKLQRLWLPSLNGAASCWPVWTLSAAT